MPSKPAAEDEVLWYLGQFLEAQSSTFSLTPQRLATILKKAKQFRKSARTRQERARSCAASTPKKPRKERSDKGTSEQLKRVARQMEKGLGYRKIAKKLRISSNTAKGYCVEVKKRGGTDRILRPQKHHKPDPFFVSPLAELLYKLCNQQKSNSLRWNVANTVLKKVMAYAVELGYEEALHEALPQRAVANAPNRTKSVHNAIRTLNVLHSPMYRGYNVGECPKVCVV